MNIVFFLFLFLWNAEKYVLAKEGKQWNDAKAMDQ